MKAIIPAAGLGTRFLPIAKAVPKEMLPLGDKPILHHVVAEAAAAGFDEILIVIRPRKECIRAYFTPDPVLERHLEQTGRTEALAAVRQATSMAGIEYVFQNEMRGLGDAVRLGCGFVAGDEAFAVLLGDTVMLGGSPLPAMREAWSRHRKPSVALEPCALDRVSRYGIAGGRALEDGCFSLDRLVEKPAPAAAPNLLDRSGAVLPPHAFAARYLLTPAIFRALETAAPGRGGEIQLTDAMESVRREGGFLGVTWPGKRLDIGDPAGLIAAAAAWTAAQD